MMQASFVPRGTADIALIYGNDALVRRNRTAEKLVEMGVVVSKRIDGKNITRFNFDDVDAVVVVASNCTHEMQEKAMRAAEKHGIPCFLITHQTSHKSWDLFMDWLRSRAMTLAEPPSRVVSIRPRISERVGPQMIIGEIAGPEAAPPLALVQPAPALPPKPQDDAELAIMYLNELEALRLEHAKVTQSRDNLAREVGRITTDSEKSVKTAKLQSERADGLAAEMKGIRESLARAVDELNKERDRAKRAETRAKDGEVSITNLRRLLEVRDGEVDALRAAAERARRLETVAEEAQRKWRDAASKIEGLLARNQQLEREKEQLASAPAAPSTKPALERTASSLDQLVADGLMDPQVAYSMLSAAVKK